MSALQTSPVMPSSFAAFMAADPTRFWHQQQQQRHQHHHHQFHRSQQQLQTGNHNTQHQLQHQIQQIHQSTASLFRQYRQQNHQSGSGIQLPDASATMSPVTPEPGHRLSSASQSPVDDGDQQQQQQQRHQLTQRQLQDHYREASVVSQLYHHQNHHNNNQNLGQTNSHLVDQQRQHLQLQTIQQQPIEHRVTQDQVHHQSDLRPQSNLKPRKSSKSGESCQRQSKSGRSNKPKRIRTIFTPEQLKRLEFEFEKQMYLVGQDRIYLANELDLNESQVKVWFQNRRIKLRKIQLAQASPMHNQQVELDLDVEQQQQHHHHLGQQQLQMF